MHNKLRGRIAERYGSQNKFSKAAGVSYVTVSRKMTGKIGFSYNDVILWSELLGIKKEEISDFFYS